MVLFDINIFVDTLTGRAGATTSTKLIDLVQKGKLNGEISSLSIPIIWYLLTKHFNSLDSKNKVITITSGFKIISLNSIIIQSAYKSSMKDFEDAIQFYSALEGNSKFLITRNLKDFTDTDKNVEVLSPEDYINKTGIK